VDWPNGQRRFDHLVTETVDPVRAGPVALTACPALLDEDRGDALGRGASGYGVRMLVELATRLARAAPRAAGHTR
jgi:hypothetical protein